MGTYQDSDGTGYLLIHHGIIYRLSEDYRSAEAKVLDGLPRSGESPAMFRKNGMYYMLYSNLTSWEKNDNYYFTAPSIEGPWTRQGFFTPEGSLTYYSQTTFVLPLIRNNDTIPMFMGDRWSFPHQASAATYVWLPMQVEGEKLMIPEYWNAWNPATIQEENPLQGWKNISFSKLKFTKKQTWSISKDGISCREKGALFQLRFKGKKIALMGETNDQSGYARITIKNNKGDVVTSSLVDFYSKFPNKGIRYLSPDLPKGQYLIQVEATGIIPVWTDKSKKRFGSFDSYINIEKIVVK
jgi:hypothetical protein